MPENLTTPAGPSVPAKGRGQGLGDTIYTAVKRALGEPASEEAFGSSYGLGDTIYTAIKKAMAASGGGGQGGGASLTGNLANLYPGNGEPSSYPLEHLSISCDVLINGHIVARGSIFSVIAGADIVLQPGGASGGAWLLVPTSATFDQDTGPSITEFTKTALTAEDSAEYSIVHIPEDIPEPIALEHEYDGEAITDYFYPIVYIARAASHDPVIS